MPPPPRLKPSTRPRARQNPTPRPAPCWPHASNPPIHHHHTPTKSPPGSVPSPPPQGEVLAEVRREFRAQQGGGRKEPYAVKYLLSDGRTRLKMLDEMIGMRT